MTPVRRFSDSQVIKNRVICHCNLDETISMIKEKLSEYQMERFRGVFGRILEVEKLKFSGHLVNHLLFKVCVGNEMVFDLNGSIVKFTEREFEIITGLRCGELPTLEGRAGHSRIYDTYFRGKKTVDFLTLKRVFKNANFMDDDDRLKLAVLFFLEGVVLKRENTSPVPKEHMDMVEDFDIFKSYPWGTLSYRLTVESLRSACDKLLEPSHIYTLLGFPLAFMIWGYETIPSLALTYGEKSKEIKTPWILNWTVTRNPEHNSLEEFFSRQEYEVVGMLKHTIVGDKTPPDDGAEEDGAAALSQETSGSDKKRKYDKVVGGACKRATRAKVPSSTSQQQSSPAAPRVVPDEGSSLKDRLSSLEGQMTTVLAKVDCMVPSTSPRVVPEEGSSVEVILSRLEGQMTTLLTKVDLMMSLSWGQSQPDVQDVNLGGDAMDTSTNIPGDATPIDERVSRCPLKAEMLSWPRDSNLTLEWISNLREMFDWSTRNLTPSEFPTVFPRRLFDRLISAATRILKQEVNCVRIDPYKLDASAVVVVGDLHGQLHDLFFLLNNAGFPSQDQIFIFNGDFVDKGAWGLETLLFLLALKVFMPQKVYLNRGNHETEDCTSRYGFKNEVLAKYGGNQGQTAYDRCIKCFNALPLASIVFGRVYIAHGGLFRSVKSKSLKSPLSIGCLDDLLTISRTKVSDPQITDILWSDPTMRDGIFPNDERNVGLLWGPNCTEMFLKQNNLKLIIRSHEGPEARVGRPGFAGMDKGFTIDHEVESGKLITVFSAPDYPQFQTTEHRFKNKGAFAVLKLPNFDNPDFHSFEAVSRPKVIVRKWNQQEEWQLVKV
ncbi:hypothetical protein FNV43_RR14022 [Rhamnella rubrinervis]|uniref:Serine/threonine-protein phosphatase n=1 Tax=Rhamnella rubrinervis TaxID=2594499 RepID=A0A8K0H232_9ROSA|nr:hypothetical protein FNV43_RR14022 [Rhamnella rubrinervis]